MQYKLIREGRFGIHKSFKTGAVVGTYPRPLLYLGLDQEGLSVIPSRNSRTVPNYLPIDIAYEDITFIKKDGFEAYKKKTTAEQPKILCVDFTISTPQQISLSYSPQTDAMSFPNFIDVCNSIIAGPCPWKTVVLDGTTGLSKIIKGHLAVMNMKAFNDARTWADAIGQKIAVIIGELCKVQAHFVVIMHESTDKIELTGEVKTEPMIYSKYRQIVGGEVSQFFHQKKVAGKPIIDTTDMAYVKGIGPRWPGGLPPECGPCFKDIYGAAVEAGEIERPL